MATTQSKHGRKFDEEFKREVATLASAPGRTDEAVGRDLGVSAWSVARWRRKFGLTKGSPPPAAPPLGSAAVAPSAAEWAGQVRALQRENEELRQQREILKKALAIFSAPPR